MSDTSTAAKPQFTVVGALPPERADPSKPLPKKEPQRSMPKWETETRERVKGAIKKCAKPLADLIARDANESSTRMLVTDFLCDGLGFDKYSELNAEYQTKGEFADFGLRIEQQLVAFVEIKRATTRLETKHLRQVEMYSVNEGVPWAILTNGAEWRAYHLTGSLPVQIDLAMTVDLTSEDSLQQKANLMFYLSRESFKRRLIDELWRAKRATSPKSFFQVISSDPVVDAIRKELKRQTGHGVEADEVRRLLKETVLRPECL